MKAFLILEKSFGSTHWQGGDQKIDIKDPSDIWASVRDWLMDNNIPLVFIRYVYFDNVLYESTSRPVLADVMTGIEI